MKLNKFIIIALLLLVFGPVMGQTDILHLKNGTVIRGTISEFVPKEHVRIKTLEGKIVEYPDAEVQKIRMDGQKQIFSLREKGYYNVASFGLMFGINGWGGIAGQPSLQVVQGYQFNGRMNAGIGLGLEVIEGQVVTPVFGEFRYHLKKEGFSPYVAANAGYNFMLSSNRYYWGGEYDSQGGIMGGLQVGIRNYTKRNLGWTMSMGYRYQQLRMTYPWYGSGIEPLSVVAPIVERTMMHRIEARFGILFH